MLIIDEISMISGTMLHQVNQKCQRFGDRALPFGGLPVVILSGDFYQFPPVHGTSLIKLPDTGIPRSKSNANSLESHLLGYKLFQKFANVITLQKQVRAGLFWTKY
jgi:hypothetical protein